MEACDLSKRDCVPCRGGVSPMEAEAARGRDCIRRLADVLVADGVSHAELARIEGEAATEMAALRDQTRAAVRQAAQ